MLADLLGAAASSSSSSSAAAAFWGLSPSDALLELLPSCSSTTTSPTLSHRSSFSSSQGSSWSVPASPAFAPVEYEPRMPMWGAAKEYDPTFAYLALGEEQEGEGYALPTHVPGWAPLWGLP